MTINHLHLGTRDLEASVRFYQDNFGFKKKFDHAPGIFLECENGHFLLAIDPVEDLPNLPKWYHFGFCLDSENKVLDLNQQMKSRNVTIVRDLLHEAGVFASFFVLDPDGNRIEVSWHNE